MRQTERKKLRQRGARRVVKLSNIFVNEKLRCPFLMLQPSPQVSLYQISDTIWISDNIVIYLIILYNIS